MGAAVSHHLYEPATRVIVFLVLLQMSRKLVDAL